MSIYELLNEEAVQDRICEETLRKQTHGKWKPYVEETGSHRELQSSAQEGHIRISSIRMSETISGNHGCRF